MEGLVRFGRKSRFVDVVGFGGDPTIASRLIDAFHTSIEDHLKMKALPWVKLKRGLRKGGR